MEAEKAELLTTDRNERVIEVTGSGLALDLPMSSAVNDIRLQGSIDWSATPAH